METRELLLIQNRLSLAGVEMPMLDMMSQSFQATADCQRRLVRRTLVVNKDIFLKGIYIISCHVSKT